jgi:hypothetical protein
MVERWGGTLWEGVAVQTRDNKDDGGRHIFCSLMFISFVWFFMDMIPSFQFPIYVSNNHLL